MPKGSGWIDEGAANTTFLSVSWLMGVCVATLASGPVPTAQFRAGKPAYTRVTGLVRDEGGRPVADVEVVLEGVNDFDKSLSVRTDADGKYAFPPIKDDLNRYHSLAVMAGKEGFVPALGHVSPLDEPRVDLTMVKGAPVSGSIRDRNGQEVGGARVQFKTLPEKIKLGPGSWHGAHYEALQGTPVERFFVARTDAKGRFRFPSLPLDQRIAFLVQAEGLRDLDTASERPERTFSARPGSPEPWLIMIPETRINGRIVSAVPGLSVNKLEIWLHVVRDDDRGLIHRTWTDAKGQFTLRGLPECSGCVELGVQHEDWVPQSAPLVTLKEGTVANVEIKIIKGIVVEGKVIAEGTETGVPRAGVGIHAASRPKATRVHHFVETDGDGRYRLRLPPGEAQFYLDRLPGEFVRPTEKGFKQVVIPQSVDRIAGPTLIAHLRTK